MSAKCCTSEAKDLAEPAKLSTDLIMDMSRGYRGGRNRGQRGRGGRGRGSFGGGKPAPAASPYGMLLEQVVSQELILQPGSSHDSSKNQISGCEYIASFNWLDCKKPTMVIPGMPPKWTPLEKPTELKQDSGEYFRDVNAAHYAAHPIEPAVRALLAQNASIHMDEVDLFACGSTVGNLLRFVRDEHQDFRFVVEIVGDTVFFIRRPNSPTEKIPDVRGYGHSFPDNYTTYDQEVSGSDSHQRLIVYDFAGLRCIIRSEGDGYLPNKAGKEELPCELLGLPDLEGLKMKKGGTRIPQAAVFDLKTRSAKRPDDYLAKEMGRLWVRQVPNFILAYHTHGTFDDIAVRDIRQDMAVWEKDHELEIGKLVALLAKITARARNKPDERFEICCQAPGVLEMRLVGGIFPPALPDDLHHVWAYGAGDHQSDSDGSEDVISGAEGSEGFGSADEEEESEKDYTACSGECEYCGHCK